MKINFNVAEWINKPRKYEILESFVKITTEPHTDFWQRSYYGFMHDNAPALLVKRSEDFSFTVKVVFEYKEKYDQCGVIIYLDSENWFKASIEYENENLSRLGSVVTNYGYSDWATTDIVPMNQMWYRLSRRGPDFLIESSIDGSKYKQMRIFHIHKLGDTTEKISRQNSLELPKQTINFGLYACSPLDSSFIATFSVLNFEKCKWISH